MPRGRPNIIITGTPGVGKSTHCELLASNTNLQHLSINAVVKEKSCHEGWDKEFQTWIIDEDRLLDELETYVPEQGGHIIDYHACDLFPESWIDLVVVLRTDTTTLYDRLKSRHYDEKKLQENLDAEIMGVIEEEAREGFPDEGVVVVLSSEVDDDVEENVGRIEEWIGNWSKSRQAGERVRIKRKNTENAL